MIHLLSLEDTSTINVNVVKNVAEHIISDSISSRGDFCVTFLDNHNRQNSKI